MPTTSLSATTIASAIVTRPLGRNCQAPSSSWHTRHTGSPLFMMPTVLKTAVGSETKTAPGRHRQVLGRLSALFFEGLVEEGEDFAVAARAVVNSGESVRARGD